MRGLSIALVFALVLCAGLISSAQGKPRKGNTRNADIIHTRKNETAEAEVKDMREIPERYEVKPVIDDTFLEQHKDGEVAEDEENEIGSHPRGRLLRRLKRSKKSKKTKKKSAKSAKSAKSKKSKKSKQSKKSKSKSKKSHKSPKSVKKSNKSNKSKQRREEEERKRREEEERRRKEEEERKRREEEEKKKRLEEERKRREEEERRRKEEERKRIEEERKRREEERKRREEEERRRKEEERKRIEEERKRREEERKRREEEERRRKEEERKRIEEEKKRIEEERKRREEEERKRKEEEEKRRKEEQERLRREEEDRKKREEEERKRREEAERKRKEEEERRRKEQEDRLRRQEEERKKIEEERKRKEEERLKEQERIRAQREKERQMKEEEREMRRKQREEERERMRILGSLKKQKYLTQCTCQASGDPHYNTFDGAMIHFMGTCEYTLARTETGFDPCSFQVTVQNENRHGNTRVAYTRRVNLRQMGMEVSMLKDNVLLINGIRQYAPISTEFFDIVTNARSLSVSTKCGLELSYTDNHFVQLSVNGTFGGRMTGLCGTCNGVKTDDYRLADGTDVTDVEARDSLIGESYAVGFSRRDLPTSCVTEPAPPPSCSKKEEKKYAMQACSLLVDRNGPFGDCLKQKEDHAYQLYESCTQDFCSFMEDKTVAQALVCKAMTTLAEVCWQAGVFVTTWREKAGCPYQCGPNSHFSSFVPKCPPTCLTAEPQGSCLTDTQEGCMCDDGYVLDNGQCVHQSQCGCVDEQGKYMPTGSSVLSQDCQHRLTCTSEGGVHEIVEEATGGCSHNAACSLVDGLKQCTCVEGYHGNGFSCEQIETEEEVLRLKEVEESKERQREFRNSHYCQCRGSGDPHYILFDGQVVHFQGHCTYMLSRGLNFNDTCYYEVKVKNRPRGNPDVSFTQTVYLETRGVKVTLDNGGKIFVNGIQMYTPLILSEQGLKIVQSGRDIEVLTECGVEVAYDGNSRVEVRLLKEMAATVDGICGNCNDVQDDFRTQTGLDVSEDENAYSLIGNSYLVVNPAGDEESNCEAAPPPQTCDQATLEMASENKFCGHLVDVNGPFAQCLDKIKEQAMEVFDSCVLDVCSYHTQPDVLKKITCDSHETMAALCEREGISVVWRTPDLCPLECPPHSHYNPLMSGCQSTCLRPAPKICPLAEREGCECNPGFLLDNGRCIQPEDCGCLAVNNFYIPVGFNITAPDCTRVFSCERTDLGSSLSMSQLNPEPCSEHGQCVSDPVSGPRCVCDPGYTGDGVNCAPVRLNDEVVHPSPVIVVDPTPPLEFLVPELGPIDPEKPELKTATTPAPPPPPTLKPQDTACNCKATGDPHYTTYDGAHLEIYNSCKYIMSETDVEKHPCAFRIEVKNEKRPHSKHPNRSYTRLMDIRLMDMTARLHRDGTVYINGDKVTPPYKSEALTIHKFGNWMNATTGCGVHIAYDGEKTAVVEAPEFYKSHLRGICGNCNDDESDDVLVDGRPIYDFQSISNGYMSLAKLFMIPDDSDKPDTSPECEPPLRPLRALMDG